MGLFNQNLNVKETVVAMDGRNVMESIQRDNDTGALIYLDSQKDFNTNSVITVAPNEQVIFVKNGEFYGTLPSGRHEVKTENYPLLSRIRNMLSGGVSTFTCQVYHVQTNEQKIDWGTSSPIEVQDFFLGGGIIGVPTQIRGAAAFRVRFNINEDDDASKRAFMRLMGDRTTFTVTDVGNLFEAEIAQKVCSVIGKTLENISTQRSINAISSQLEDFSIVLKPRFDELFVEYGLELINFSFYNLNIVETEERKKYLDRLIAAAHTGSYDKAVQQELLKDVVVNPGIDGIANAGVGLGMGVVAGNVFAQMATTAFGNTPPQQNPLTHGIGSANVFGVGNPSQQSSPSPADPVEILSKMKQMLDAGLISQQIYDAKVAEIMSRL